MTLHLDPELMVSARDAIIQDCQCVRVMSYASETKSRKTSEERTAVRFTSMNTKATCNPLHLKWCHAKTILW